MNEQGINATEMLLYATNGCKYATERENVSRIRWRDDEQRNTRRWKRRAQNTIDSPGLRRALNDNRTPNRITLPQICDRRGK